MAGAAWNVAYLVRGKRTANSVSITTAIYSTVTVYMGLATLLTPLIGPLFLCETRETGSWDFEIDCPYPDAWSDRYYVVGVAPMASGLVGLALSFAARFGPPAVVAVEPVPAWSAGPITLPAVDGAAPGAGFSVRW